MIKLRTLQPLLALLALLTAGCFTNESDTIRTLEASGYTDIQTTGYVPWTCGRDDTFHTGFAATNPAGRRVAGVVCCGAWGKGCTVRF